MGHARLLTLTGVGGVGKSRLALQLACDVRRHYRDGVWLVELAAVEDPLRVPQAVGAALGLREHSTRSPMHVLRDYLLDKRLLLILDNCEHLLDSCADLAGTLLRHASELRILTTSRQPLGIAGEQLFAVGSLSIPEANSDPTPEHVAQYDAVRLFTDRACAMVPGFALTGDNCALVTQVCQRLDGIPLAIELAAARLRLLSVPELLDRLDNCFHLLTTGNRIALPRQQTLRATIDWSYQLCSANERLMWARSSVFTGGFDLDAAEAVCSGADIGGEPVVDLVVGLVEKSILLRDDQGDRTRYRVLETVRQYGRELRIASGEDAALRRRQRDWYLSQAEQAEAAWSGPDQVKWLWRLHQDQANLRAALDYCVTEPCQARAGLRLASALWGYWLFSGTLGEGRQWLDRALRADAEPSLERAKALWAAAHLAGLQGDLEIAQQLIDECQALAVRLDDPRTLAHAVQFAGATAMFRGEMTKALNLLADSLDRHRAHDDVNAVWLALYQLTLTATVLGDARTKDLCDECLGLAEEQGADWSKSYALWVGAQERWRHGDLASATSRLREGIELRQRLNDQMGIAQCLEVLAWTATDAGEHVRGARLLGAAEMAWRLVGVQLAGLLHLASAHDRCEKDLRASLGERSFTANFDQGVDLNLGEAVTYALGRCREEATARSMPGAPSTDVLTHREREVARLIAHGMSNKKIADRLTISQRTAEAHVEHILVKLGFTSRAQVAAWAVDT